MKCRSEGKRAGANVAAGERRRAHVARGPPERRGGGSGARGGRESSRRAEGRRTRARGPRGPARRPKWGRTSSGIASCRGRALNDMPRGSTCAPERSRSGGRRALRELENALKRCRITCARVRPSYAGNSRAINSNGKRNSKKSQVAYAFRLHVLHQDLQAVRIQCNPPTRTFLRTKL